MSDQRVNSDGKPMRKRRWKDGNLYWPEEIEALEAAAAKTSPTPHKADPPPQEEVKARKSRGASSELIEAVKDDLAAKVKKVTKNESPSAVLYKNEEEVFLTTYLYIVNEKFDKSNSLRGVNFTDLNTILNGFDFKLSNVCKVQDRVLELTIIPAYVNNFPIDALNEMLNWFYKKFSISPANTTIIMSSQKQIRFP